MQRGISFELHTTIIAAVLLLTACATTLATDNEPNLSPSQAAIEQLRQLADTSDGTMPVYYDYMENGTLTGGKTFMPVPSPPQESLSSLSAYASYTLINNGPSTNRIDLVCVGDGYTAGEMDTYWQHVQTVIDNFFQEPPLNQYASFFNVHVVEVVSNQSGVDEPDNGIYRDTALNMTFNCNGIDRLLCIDYAKAWTAASNAPATDLVIAIANTSRYGGAGYSSLSTLSGDNDASVEVALHEFGHSFAGLADEYHYYDGTTYTGSEPSEVNISIYTASQQLASQRKWYRWMDVSQVDAFEGAYYKQYGIYRPTADSKMRSLGVPFGSVNTEQFLLSIYNKVSPIDQVIPAQAGVHSGEKTFTAVCQSPSPDTLEYTWKVDGITVVTTGEPAFCPVTFLQPNTIQTLTVTVTDRTDLVRNEGKRSSLMTDQHQWQVWRASADFVPDGVVDAADVAAMGPFWLTNNPQCDIAPHGGDGIVDLKDFAVLAEQWLISPESPPAPFAHWALDGNPDDSAGLAYHGIAYGNPVWEPTGPIGESVRLDGEDDYIQMPGFKGVTGTASRTCMAWIQTARQGNILSWGTEQNGQKWMLRVESNGTLGVGIWGGYINSAATVHDGQWHHVAAVLSDDDSPNVSEILLYIDGVLSGTSASNTQSIETAIGQDVIIGAYENAGILGYYFEGGIDDVRIYNQALTGDHVRAVMRGGN